MGGWGVDALLGRQTRPHKDLDVLVLVDDLPDRLPTAFVATDPAGRELDVHVVEITSRGHVVVLCDVPWRLDANALDGRGRIGGVEVACASADAQIAMHDGYDLPDTHRRDVALLQELRHAADEDTAPKP